MNNSFEALTGDQWCFHPPSTGKGYAGQVAHWAKVSERRLTFTYRKIGHDHSPCWIAQPKVAGEALEEPYFGYGSGKKLAKEDACRKMAESGHCVRS
ncbi:hypothetical protein FRC11_007650 [Ceratobasidium sp. 423]|nr:hypothetical protein FRC11_007650 [Ceratobasidium sp. 423]